MRGTITYSVEVDSVQKLTALRDKAGALIDDDPETTLTAANSAVDDFEFTLWGSIRGKPDDRWGPVVIRAQNVSEAEHKAVEADKKRTVVTCLPGRVG